MSEGLIKVDVGRLAEPAKVLIEKISEAVGLAYEPTRIRRRAKAEGDAEVYAAEAEGKAALIRARTDIELTDLNRRALTRFLAEETKKQVNMESITGKALEQLKEDATPQNMDDDWVSHFFDSSRYVSNEEMQSLWAKILAGEANEPGSFSRRTVTLVSTLSPKEAALFTELCRFCAVGGATIPFIYDANEEVYQQRGLNFESLTHLDNIGLITFDNITGFVMNSSEPEVVLDYYGTKTRLRLEVVEEKRRLDIGKAILTEAGKELFSATMAKPLAGFLDSLDSRWIDMGLSPSSDMEWRPSS
jgi:hypothetical protein